MLKPTPRKLFSVLAAITFLSGCVSDGIEKRDSANGINEKDRALQSIRDFYARTGREAYFDELEHASLIRTMRCENGYIVYFVPKQHQVERPEILFTVDGSKFEVNRPDFRPVNCVLY